MRAPKEAKVGLGFILLMALGWGLFGFITNYAKHANQNEPHPEAERRISELESQVRALLSEEEE